MMKRIYSCETYGVLRVRHGIEWSQSHGELVDNEVVGIILLLNQSTEPLFVLGTEKEYSMGLTPYSYRSLLT